MCVCASVQVIGCAGGTVVTLAVKQPAQCVCSVLSPTVTSTPTATSRRVVSLSAVTVAFGIAFAWRTKIWRSTQPRLSICTCQSRRYARLLLQWFFDSFTSVCVCALCYTVCHCLHFLHVKSVVYWADCIQIFCVSLKRVSNYIN